MTSSVRFVQCMKITNVSNITTIWNSVGERDRQTDRVRMKDCLGENDGQLDSLQQYFYSKIGILFRNLVYFVCNREFNQLWNKMGIFLIALAKHFHFFIKSIQLYNCIASLYVNQYMMQIAKTQTNILGCRCFFQLNNY